MKLLTNAKLIVKDQVLEGFGIQFDTHIQKIAPLAAFDTTEYEVIDCEECFVSPGFIDVHIHGSNGADVMDGTSEALDCISKSLCRSGVTSYLATTMTMPMKEIDEALHAADRYREGTMPFAQLIGVHLEGPYINASYKGAQNPEFIQKPDGDWIRQYYGLVKLITVAPEVEGALAFIEQVRKESDMVVSIGHSDATYKDCCNAHEKGAEHITHLFNAMKPLHHREPGVVGAALALDFSCEVILDQVHFSEELFDLIYRIKGPDKLIAVTDSIRAGCLKPGLYELGGQKVIVDKESARLESGQLAGSILTLDQALRNFIEKTERDIPSAVKLVTENPTHLLKLTDRGRLEEGRRADFTIFNDKIQIAATFVSGAVTYKKEH